MSQLRCYRSFLFCWDFYSIRVATQQLSYIISLLLKCTTISFDVYFELSSIDMLLLFGNALDLMHSTKLVKNI